MATLNLKYPPYYAHEIPSLISEGITGEEFELMPTENRHKLADWEGTFPNIVRLVQRIKLNIWREVIEFLDSEGSDALFWSPPP